MSHPQWTVTAATWPMVGMLITILLRKFRMERCVSITNLMVCVDLSSALLHICGLLLFALFIPSHSNTDKLRYLNYDLLLR